MPWSLRQQPLDRRLGRRSFLVASLAMAGGGIVARTLLRSSPPSVSAMVPLGLSPGAPLAFLSTDAVAQGEAFSLHVQSFYVSAGTATFNGVHYKLFPNGEYLEAIIAAGQAITDAIEIEPADYQVQVDIAETAGRQSSFSLPISVTKTAFPVDAIQLPPSTAALLAPTTVEEELIRLGGVYGPVTATALWRGLFRVPTPGPITTQFGEARSYNGGPVSGHHSGTDIGADAGTPVVAAAAGRVAFTGQLAERGSFVAIDHGLGVYTGYAHLSQISSTVDTGVQQGDPIGLVGTTGLSTGPHLHWECAVSGIHIDAMRWTRTLLP